MCQDLIESLNSSHQLSLKCLVNKSICQQLDGKITSLIHVIQQHLDDQIYLAPKSYHHLNSIILKINALFQKSLQKSWTNTFHKHAVQEEYQNILNDLDDLFREVPTLTPLTDPILVKIKSNLNLSSNRSNSGLPTPPRRGSVALPDGETETVESTLNALRTGLQNKSESLISIALGNIARLSTGSYTRQTDYTKRGACDLICTSLRFYPNHRTIGEHGAQSMYNLCQVPENLENIYESGGPETLIHILASNPDNVAVIREVCHTVDFLCQNHENSRKKFHSNGLTNILFESLKTHYKSLEICEICLSTIYELGYEAIPHPDETLTNINSISHMLLKIYSCHHDYQIIIRYLTWIIINLSVEPINHSVLRDLDLFQVLIKCLVQYHTDEEICESCLGSIIYLCQDNILNQTAFSYYDISYALGQILESHLQIHSNSQSSPNTLLSSSSTMIAEMTCIVIIQLTANDHYENIINLGIPSILKGLVAVVQLHYLDENGPALLREAYGAIRNLCHSNRTNTLLLDSFGGSDVLLESLEKFSDMMGSDFILRGITALYSLIRHRDTGILDHIIEKGGFLILIHILQQYITNEMVIENLILIISNILSSYTSQDTSFIESSLLSLLQLHSHIIQCLEFYSNNDVVIENCYLILSDILQRNECSRNPIIEWTETSNIILKSLQRCYEFTIICSLGCYLLDYLIQNNLANDSVIFDTTNGVCEFAVTALKFHSTSLTTSLMICRFMNAMIRNQSVKIILLSSCGCCEVVISLLQNLLPPLPPPAASSTTSTSSSSVTFEQEKLDLLVTICQCLQYFTTKTASFHMLLEFNTLPLLLSYLPLPILQLTSQDPNDHESILQGDSSMKIYDVLDDEDEDIIRYQHAMDINHTTPIICFDILCKTILILLQAGEGKFDSTILVIANERLTCVLLQKIQSFLHKEHDLDDCRQSDDDDGSETSNTHPATTLNALLQTFSSLIDIDLQFLRTSNMNQQQVAQYNTNILEHFFLILNSLPKHLLVIQILLTVSDHLLLSYSDPKSSFLNKLSGKKTELQKLFAICEENGEEGRVLTEELDRLINLF